MSFLSAWALAIGLLVVAPVVAHLLRRRNAEERPFPPARLVPPTPPAARRKSLLEDRTLFSLRAVSVVVLALLGATPFVRCSRLALGRRQGASVALAIVLDDSMSMKAKLPGGATRWARALGAARELTHGLAGGDEVAVVLAGAPPRVVLGSTTNMSAVSATLDGLEPSDRATDLDGAVALAKSLLRGLAQRDKRVVLFSDLADGSPPDAPPLGGDGEITLWAPLKELTADGADCGITRADRSGSKVWVRVVCTSASSPPAHTAPATSASAAASAVAGRPESPAAPSGPARSVEIRDGAKVVAKAALGADVHTTEVGIDLPDEPPSEKAQASASLVAVLTGSDAIPDDDEAPVVHAGGALPMAVVSDASSTHVATGGPPPIEQALSALDLDAQVHPLPTVPEHADELAGIAALIIDDVPGFTPEVRRTLAAWVAKGGVLLLTLGPRAAAAPLGAGFDPLVRGVVRWGPSPVPGLDPATAAMFGASAEGMADLAPHGRASLDPPDADADVLSRWKDGAPFLLRRSIGRGVVLSLTLPLGTDESDLALRPAFLALLDRFVSTARARGGARRIDVGEVWTFDGYRNVKVERVPSPDAPPAAKPRPIPVVDGASSASPAKPAPAGLMASGEERHLRAAPPLAGLYSLELDGDQTTRVAAVPEREIDLRPRRIREDARAASLGGIDPSLDFSPYVAMFLLVLFAAELALRVVQSWPQKKTLEPGP